MYIYNAKILTMDSPDIELGYVEIQNGKITKIKQGILPAPSSIDVDANGATLLPGFIDTHTHLGIIEDGLGFEGDDCNEQTDPLTPHIRALDAINPTDDCFREAYEAGITSAVISPGSANPISGEMVAVKTKGRRIDDMVIKTVGMKFALGENPKTVYNDKSVTPITRMATASIIREALFKAKKYNDDVIAAAENPDLDPPEYDMKCEALLPVINHEIKAHFHCHRADDIFTAIRISKEFDIDYVLVHATEGHIVADILGEEGSKAIIGPIICDRSKPEMKKLTEKNAFEMFRNGVQLAICTDHPVIPIQFLPLSAAIAVRGGLAPKAALKAITIEAAKIVGIDSRVGSITVGKDADIVMFDSSPLEVMSTPKMVMINGKVVLNNLND